MRFRLHEPWPDFLTYYATPATGAGWIVPKNYTEKVGSDKFKEQPVGLGQYRIVSHQAGIELVMEANLDYWRKVPHVKRLVFKSVPEATTRLAMLKKQEADVAYGLYGTLAEEVRRDAHLKLEPVIPPGTLWFELTEQYNPQSPWSDKRDRRRQTTPCIGRPSTRQRPWDTRCCQGTLCRAGLTMPWRSSRIPTTPRKPRSC